MGFDEVGPIGKLVKIVNPVPHLRRKWAPAPGPGDAGRDGDAPRGSRLRGLRVARFAHFFEIDDGGWPEAHPQHVMASRDAASMEWRYVECPLQSYEKRQLRSGPDLLGWVVFHTLEERGVRYGVLDECFSPRDDGLGPLVDVAIGGCLEQNVDAIVAWAPPSTALHRALRDHGFALRPSPRSLIVRRIADRVPESVLGAEFWYYTIIDTDAAAPWRRVSRLRIPEGRRTRMTAPQLSPDTAGRSASRHAGQAVEIREVVRR
jgi:hypothetical protein